MWLEVASSGGVTSPNDQPEWLGMRTELIRDAVEEGIAYGGEPVAAHAIGYAGIEAAVEAGVKFGGLTRAEAIVAGTRTSARLCGLDDHLGTVETGKIADIVVAEGNPLDDIDSLGDPAKILLVIKDGVAVVDRDGFLSPTR